MTPTDLRIALSRLGAIEHNSVYIWGDVDADTPEVARATWERIGSHIDDTDGGFWLHQVVTPDFPLIGCYRPFANVEG